MLLKVLQRRIVQKSRPQRHKRAPRLRWLPLVLLLVAWEACTLAA